LPLKLVFTLLVLANLLVEAKTVMIPPPEGMVPFAIFSPENDIERK